MKSEVKGKMNMNNMYVELTKIEKVLRKHRNKKYKESLTSHFMQLHLGPVFEDSDVAMKKKLLYM